MQCVVHIVPGFPICFHLEMPHENQDWFDNWYTQWWQVQESAIMIYRLVGCELLCLEEEGNSLQGILFGSHKMLKAVKDI